MSWVALVLHVALVVAAGPALAGLGGRVRGAPVQQAWRDLVRLWRKAGMAPAGASAVFAGAPVVSLAAALLAAVLVPSLALGLPTGGAMDLVVVVGLLLLSRRVPALAAHDVGVAAAFAGQRAMQVGGLPVLLLVGLALMQVAGATNLEAAVGSVRDGGVAARGAGLLAGAAVFGVLLSEAATPAGAYAGRARAVAVVAGWLREVAGLSLVAAVALPFGVAPAGSGVEAWLVGAACWALKLGALGMVAAWTGRVRVLPAAALAAGLAVVVASAQGAA